MRCLRLLSPGEQVRLGWLELVEHVPNDLDRLHGQRHDVGWDVLRPDVLLLHLQFQLFHHLRRDDPQAIVEVELFWRRQPQFPGPHAGQQQQAEAKLRFQLAGVLAQQLQELGQFGHAQEGVVAYRRLGHGDHIQVGGRVLFQARHDHEGIPEELVEPGAHLLGDGWRAALLDAADDFK